MRDGELRDLSDSSGLLRDSEGREIGFRRGGLNFWTGGPRIYLISRPSFDSAELLRYLRESDLELPKHDQLCGEAGDNLFEAGARDCYLSYGRGRNHADNIANCREQRHGSVFEHGSITIKIAGVSRGFTHELVRHRVGVAYSQVSTRYVDPRQLGFVVPPLLVERPELMDAYATSCLRSLDYYEALRDRLEPALQGPEESRTSARKRARGAVRSALPIGLAQVLQMTLNLRITRHVLVMRGSPHAEEEIRLFARRLLAVAERVWPQGLADALDTEEGVSLNEGAF